MKHIFIIVLIAAGCGGEELPSLAQQAATISDRTSCARTQDPTGCGAQIACSGKLSDCADQGCWVQGSDLYLYADGSWRDPSAQPGRWLIDGRAHLILGSSDVGLVAQDGDIPTPSCTP